MGIPTVYASETVADIYKNEQYSEMGGIGETLGKGMDEEDGVSAHGGLLFRISKDKETGEYNGYYFALDILKQQVALVKLSEDGWDEITTKKMSIEYGKVYHATIIVAQNHIICYMDYNGVGYAKLDIIDGEYTSGGIGVYNHILNADYGELKVKAYTEKEILENESYTNPVFDKCADPDILYYNGTYYLYFVRFTAGNVIWGAELYDDMKSIKEETLTQISRANQEWDEDMMRVNEGTYMLVKDGKYYMTYSGSHFESVNYGAGYAVADSPLGSFTKYENNPIMQSNSLVHGAGHHCVAVSPDGKELFMVYHCHHSLIATDPRRLCIDCMQFTEDIGGNIVLEVKDSTVTPQELPSGSVNVDNFIEFKEIDFGPVKVNKSMTVEEIREQLPTELLIRTSQDNQSPAVIVWNLDNNIIEGGGEEIIVKGMASLPETVDNFGNIPLDVEVKIVFDLPASDNNSF